MEPPFSTDVQEFDADERISYSKLDNKFIGVLEDGSEFEFEHETRKWIPADVVTSEPAQPAESGSSGIDHDRKRKLDQDQSTEPQKLKAPRAPKKQKAPPPPKQNTAVYITGLPLDTTVAEVAEVFGRKAGLIALEIESGAPRIKLYTDAEGNFKGDALVVYFQPESVGMAIMLLDDSYFRVSPTGVQEGKIRVQAADTSYKKVQYDGNGQGQGGTASSAQKVDKRQQRNDSDRQKIIKRTQKLNAKLADWDDDDPYPALSERESKWDKTITLRHMFTLQELEEDPAALLEIKEDIRNECAKMGTVTSVVLYDLEPEGVVRVKFRDAQSAQDCIRVMHGRHFSGLVVQAMLARPEEKFRKTSKQGDDGDSD